MIEGWLTFRREIGDLKAYGWVIFCCHRGFGARSWSGGAQKRRPSQESVAKGEEAVKLGGIFQQPSIPHLSIAKDVFQDMERMLHPGTYLDFHPLQSQGQLLDLGVAVLTHHLRRRQYVPPL